MASSTTGARCGRVSIAHTSRYVTTVAGSDGGGTSLLLLLVLSSFVRYPFNSSACLFIHETLHSIWPRLRFRTGPAIILLPIEIDEAPFDEECEGLDIVFREG